MPTQSRAIREQVSPYKGNELQKLKTVITQYAINQSPDGTVTSIATGTNLTGGPITVTGTIDVEVTKSGATQVAAGAAAGELWATASHATLPDNVILGGV